MMTFSELSRNSLVLVWHYSWAPLLKCTLSLLEPFHSYIWTCNKNWYFGSLGIWIWFLHAQLLGRWLSTKFCKCWGSATSNFQYAGDVHMSSWLWGHVNEVDHHKTGWHSIAVNIYMHSCLLGNIFTGLHIVGHRYLVCYAQAWTQEGERKFFTMVTNQLAYFI